MKTFLDAPLLIYLNTVGSREARTLYENFYLRVLEKYRVYTDVLVLDELIYVSRKKYGIPYELSIEFVESTVLPYVTLVDVGEEEYNHAVEAMKEGLRPSDAIHIGAMRSNGVELIVSEDSDFDRVKGIKRIWITLDEAFAP
ncbi:MAG: type II toxin-antitoxin system VapC family toxin [Candidatus Methanodesulfokora sp.]|jgi:predicted nucleic acid-binding protein